MRVWEIGVFGERNEVEKKEFAFDIEWWNVLDDNWKDILRKNIKGNENEVDFFERINDLTELDLYSKGSRNYGKLKKLMIQRVNSVCQKNKIWF